MMELLFVAVLAILDSCVSPLRMALPAKASSLIRGFGGIRSSRRSNAIQRRKDSNMKLKDKTTDALGFAQTPSRLTTNGISENRAPNHDEVRRRAYEIYLERGGVRAKSLRTGSRLSEKSKVQHTL